MSKKWLCDFIDHAVVLTNKAECKPSVFHFQTGGGGGGGGEGRERARL